MKLEMRQFIHLILVSCIFMIEAYDVKYTIYNGMNLVDTIKDEYSMNIGFSIYNHNKVTPHTCLVKCNKETNCQIVVYTVMSTTTAYCEFYNKTGPLQKCTDMIDSISSTVFLKKCNLDCTCSQTSFWSATRNCCVQCPLNWIFYQNHCFFISQTVEDYTQANNWCQSNYNSTLISLKDQQQYRFWSSYLINSTSKCFLTASLSYNGSSFSWSDGNPMFNNTWIQQGYKTNLVNYWPITGDTRDIVGGADLYNPVNATLGLDRFNTSNSSISLNGGYYLVPTGVYFSGDLTIMTWINPTSYQAQSKILDFSNGAFKESVIFSFSNGIGLYLSLSFFDDNSNLIFRSTQSLTLNRWSHITATLNFTTLCIYINGNLTDIGTNTNPALPRNISRTLNYIGKSQFDGDSNAYADMDEIKILNKALNLEEIQMEFNTPPLDYPSPCGKICNIGSSNMYLSSIYCSEMMNYICEIV